jgi:hypothetical protein
MSFSLQIFHAIVVKKNYYHMWFPFLGLEDLHNNDVQTTNVEDMRKKLHAKCSSPFVICHKKVCIEEVAQDGPILIIWHPSVKINKLPALVSTKMYTFATFYLCNVSLKFHIISTSVNLLTPCHISKTCQLLIFLKIPYENKVEKTIISNCCYPQVWIDLWVTM